MKLVSFLMPTRSAPLPMLKSAVRSILDTAANRDDLEILLKVDEDDKERIVFAQELVKDCGRCVISHRGRGYNDMARFVTELIGVADSHWGWLFDDDSWVEGDWYNPLSQIPSNGKKGPAVNAEYYVLGESIYRNGAQGGAPGLIMPMDFCKHHEHSTPVDALWLDALLRRNWIIQQLPNVFYHHDGRERK